MIYRGNTYLMHPTSEQSELLVQHANVCRLIWNLALEQRRDHWRLYQSKTGNNLNYVTQSRELTLLRAEVDFIRDVSQNAEERVIKDLDTAYQRAFKGLGGFPDFKRKGLHEAFSLSGRNVSVKRINKRWGSINLPKIGWTKIRMPRNIEGKITEAAVRLTVRGWQVSVSYKAEGGIDDISGAVGIDRGVAVPLMLSDGTSYSLPANLAVNEKRARKAQHDAARGKRGSNRNTKAKRRTALLRAKVARIRKDWAHKSTTQIATQYGTVVIERLRTKDMTKSASGTLEAPGKNVAQKRGLNRAILNVAWGQIEQMLFYKAFKVIKVDPRYTSQTCSDCGVVDSKSRKSQSRFICTSCGHADNADRNAAINILNRASSPVVETRVAASSKREPVTA